MTESASSPDQTEGEGAAEAPLLQNAYDFLNESIRAFELAVNGSDRHWKFAIVHVAQTIELLLKARLMREHPLLVFDKVEKTTGRTVTQDVALIRLSSCGVLLDNEDLRRIRIARDLRNDVTHFSVDVDPVHFRACYTDLFEFAHVFHEKEIGGELHDHVESELWPAEARVMEDFRRSIVTFQGEEIDAKYAVAIVEAQYVTHYTIDGVAYARIPYGDSNDLLTASEGSRCHDCTVRTGQFHAWECDAERCPRCEGQWIGCECFEDDDDDGQAS